MAEAQEKIASYRVRSDIVVVDLIVLDSEGNFVPGLTAADVVLEEKRKKQKIVYFGLAGEGSEEAESAGSPSGSIAFGAPGDEISIVLGVDLGSIRAQDLGFVKQSIASYFVDRETPSNARFMLAGIGRGLRILQPFTKDGAKIRDALDRLSTSSNPEALTFSRFSEEVEQAFNSGFQLGGSNGGLLLEAARAAADRGNAYLSRVNEQIKRSCQGMELLARHLASLPGRKHVVLYSSGYPVEAYNEIRTLLMERVRSETGRAPTGDFAAQLSAAIGRLRRSQPHESLNSVLNEANRSQVAFYAVDARGLMTSNPDIRQSTSPGGSTGALRGNSFALAKRDISLSQDFLVSLASGTGGEAFLNNNDLRKGIDRAYRDAGRYYLIAYKPSRKGKDGEFRSIKVKVKRRGLTERYRRGYIVASDKKRAQEEIYTALAFPHLFDRFELALELSQQGSQLEVLTGIPTGSLDFATDGKNKFSCTIEVYGVLIDESGQWVTEKVTFAKRIPLSRDRQGLAQLRQTQFAVVDEKVKVKPGTYKLVVVVRQGVAGKMSAVVREVTIT